MKTLPCKDCLTLAICKAEKIKIFEDVHNHYHSRLRFRYKLMDKCSIVKEFIQNEEITATQSKTIRCSTFYNFFNVSGWGDD